MNNKKFHQLLHPLFLAAVIILLANDIFLKYTFHNWVTGKLSDFTGLFAFSFLLFVCLPSRKRLVFIGCIAFFCWWKSPLSEALINWTNTLLPFTVGRIPDLTDLIALTVLPWSWKLSNQPFNLSIPFQRLYINFVCILSLFAFCNTSTYRQLYSYPDNYIHFNYRFKTEKTEADILDMLSARQLKYSREFLHYYPALKEDYYYRVKNLTDSIPQWTPVVNNSDSTLYIKTPDSPFYNISTYILDGDKLFNVEFRFISGDHRKNTIIIKSFQTRAHDPVKIYSGKINRRYKRHFKEMFR